MTPIINTAESDQKSSHELIAEQKKSLDCATKLPVGKKVVVMKTNNQIQELQTILKDRKSTRSDFIFSADRLIRLVIEEGLNQLPFKECSVETQTGENYVGCEFYKGICGVSIIRSGEAMEKGLRDCCRSVRIGKLLMSRDEETQERKVIYARFPNDIFQRKVLLMYPLLISGGNVKLAVDTLVEHGVIEENIHILTLFATPKSVNSLFEKHPNVSFLTTEIDDEVPGNFGTMYFGTS